MTKDIIQIFTDGACKGNPGPGGWGVLLRYNDHEKELSGFCDNTTNNQMELLAAIKGIEAVRQKKKIQLYTDSQYLKKGMTEWMVKWKENHWKSAQKKPVKNKELWQRLDALNMTHDIEWHWVKGHAGHAENERADALACQAIDKNLK